MLNVLTTQTKHTKPKGHKEVMVSWVFAQSQSHQTVHVKYVQFFCTSIIYANNLFILNLYKVNTSVIYKIIGLCFF